MSENFLLGTGLLLFGIALLAGAASSPAPLSLVPTLAAALAFLGAFHRLANP